MRFLFCAIVFISIGGCSKRWVGKVDQRDQLQQQSACNANGSYATIAANPHYEKSSFHQWLFGKRYRDLWSEPVKVKLIDIQNSDFEILKVGGGRQTYNLRVIDPEDNQYVLRTVDKAPTKVLPKIVKQSFVGTLLKDQVSSGHPYAPLVLPLMSDALGIYHTNPKLRFVCSESLPNEDYHIFSGAMVVMEHRPDEDQSEFSYLGNSENVVGSHNMLDDLLKENDSRVDTYHYLKTRFFDMIIGDWSRHEGNWRWATYEQPKGTFYRAVPRDRDHAFYYLDGVVPKLIRTFFKPHFRSFKARLPNLRKLNASAEHLDRLLLSSLNFNEWQAIADSVKTQLTDSVIDEAMKALPQEIYNVSGTELAQKLKHRRDMLPEKIDTYYRFLSKKPDIYGTDKHERFVITAVEDKVRVVIYKTKKEGDISKEIFSRLFDPDETKEISLYGLAGNDRFVFNGNGRSPIGVRVFGGAGEDWFEQQTEGKLFKVMIIDTEKGSHWTKLNKGIKVRKADPETSYFDANGVLLDFYIWD
ncbi:hypothetical protein GCM10009122_57110 [Fulvivirga kasyanovii]|uniref:Uncharacterized protein n=1 Tax=Fulvivirga kasyanovii TaxID=396812 RepID=A0ABW9RLD1_9BACT|nr:hypothetical protein [Fulvivirga kasyanovii]MTI24154.1 hypothetical protein [Fulvivirga kasyanovii]